jgi:hypothetical protein
MRYALNLRIIPTRVGLFTSFPIKKSHDLIDAELRVSRRDKSPSSPNVPRNIIYSILPFSSTTIDFNL